MLCSDDYFIRNFCIDILNITLKLQQKLEGDVGCVVWDAAIVLAKYLEELYKKNTDYFKNLSVLELGSGVGCVGLTAATLGANVLLTDLPAIVPLLENNVKLNKESLHSNAGKVEVLPLPWGKKLDMDQKPNLILLADCIYYKESVDSLICTLKNLSGPQTKILLSQEIRESKKQQDCWEFFMVNVRKHFIYHFVSLEEQNDTFRSEDIMLLQLLPL